MRYTVVSLALWLPAVFHSSAWINYTEKGLWALIMCVLQADIPFVVTAHHGSGLKLVWVFMPAIKSRTW